MATAAVTPAMRSLGWNIELFIEPDEVAFAGVFQPASNVSLTFRDIVDEIRLSFEFPQESSDFLNQVAFGILKMRNIDEHECPAPIFVHGAGLDQRVPALPELRHDALKDRVILQYQFFKHHDCTLTAEQSFQCHFEAGCAQHLSQPVRRLEPRYLPPKKISTDPRYATYPLRKRMQGRKCVPSKRTASGSMSSRPDPETELADEDLASMVAPPECNISDERAKATMANFRNSCLSRSAHCAVTGMGLSWYITPAIGPALHACHIVSQLHYHTYPPFRSEANEAQADGEGAFSYHLQKAWERTWAPENGIILFSHLHEMFDQRLFSIHPETFRIRVFMPYDILLAYHGLEAKLHHQVAKAALRHHYDMCCIENMAARMPMVEQLLQSRSASSISSIGTPLPYRSTLGEIEGPDEQRPDGDPTKRARQTGRQYLPGNASAGDISVNDLAAPPSFIWPRPRKRKRNQSAIYEGYITPENSTQFLADVNWKLQNLGRT